MSRTATPAPITDARMWRKLLARLHPDAGGDHELFLFGQAVRERVATGDLLAHDAVGDAPRRSGTPPARERPRAKARGRSTAGGKSRITGEVAEPFEELTRRAVELAQDLEAPYGWLLGLLEGCEAPRADAPVHLVQEARLGADYKRLARAGRAIGLDGQGRGRLYRLAARVPLTDYHARILLDRLEGGGADTPHP